MCVVPADVRHKPYTIHSFFHCEGFHDLASYDRNLREAPLSELEGAIREADRQCAIQVLCAPQVKNDGLKNDWVNALWVECFIFYFGYRSIFGDCVVNHRLKHKMLFM